MGVKILQNTGHQLTPAVRSMAEVFLAHYAGEGRGEVLYGDIQRYRVVPEKDSIPEEVRIEIPSPTVAETRLKEK
ncbi:MAG: hypothetical protein WC076_12975 [Terrimicrobiaceae bacterium]